MIRLYEELDYLQNTVQTNLWLITIQKKFNEE